METPSVANPVANSHPSEPIQSSGGVRFSAYSMKPACLLSEPKKTKLSPFPPIKETLLSRSAGTRKKSFLRGIFKHSETGRFFWRFTFQGRRHFVNLNTTDPDLAQSAALKEKATLFGTLQHRTTLDEQRAYVANLEAQKSSKKTEIVRGCSIRRVSSNGIAVSIESPGDTARPLYLAPRDISVC